MTLALLALALGCKGIDAQDLDRRTYAVDMGAATWVEPPPGLGEVVIVPTDEQILVGVRGGNGVAIDLVITLGNGTIDEPAQDPTRLTFSLPDVSLDRDGVIAFGPADIRAKGSDAELIVEDLVVTGRFATDGSAIDDLATTGRLDAYGIYEAAGFPNPEGLCGILPTLGGKCVACDDGGERCMPFDVQVGHAPLAQNLTLVESASGSLCSGVLLLPVGAMFFRRRKATA